MQDKLTSVSKMAQQEEGRQLAESIELAGPLDKRIEEILRVKDEAPILISYPSSESLQEFESDEINFEQNWYYAMKAEQIKKKMDQATKAFHERDEYYRDPKLYDSFYAEYTKHVGKVKDVSEEAPEKSKSLQVTPKIECELCGGNHRVEQCPHERKFTLGMDTTSSDTKDRLPNGKSKSVDYSKPQWK